MILKERKIDTWIGDLTNCYVILDEESKEVMCIDPAGDAEQLANLIKNVLHGNLKYIYLTHCHGDHIGGVTKLKSHFGGKVLIHRDDSDGLNDFNVNLSGIIDLPEIQLEADSRVDDGDLLHLGNLEFQVLHTPGHTKGSTSLYCKNEGCVFTGDTLFSGTWGRTDLPTGSLQDIMNSITKKLLLLPDETICYPGHGKPTKVCDEKPIYLELKPKMW